MLGRGGRGRLHVPDVDHGETEEAFPGERALDQVLGAVRKLLELQMGQVPPTVSRRAYAGFPSNQRKKTPSSFHPGVGS